MSTRPVEALIETELGEPRWRAGVSGEKVTTSRRRKSAKTRLCEPPLSRDHHLIKRSENQKGPSTLIVLLRERFFRENSENESER